MGSEKVQSATYKREDSAGKTWVLLISRCADQNPLSLFQEKKKQQGNQPASALQATENFRLFVIQGQEQQAGDGTVYFSGMLPG